MGKTTRKKYTPEFKAKVALDASNAIEVLDAAVRRHGAPEIINSNQGCQYTRKEWHETCKKAWRTTLIITTPDAIIRALIIIFRRPDMRPLSRHKKQYRSIG